MKWSAHVYLAYTYSQSRFMIWCLTNEKWHSKLHNGTNYLLVYSEQDDTHTSKAIFHDYIMIISCRYETTYDYSIPRAVESSRLRIHDRRGGQSWSIEVQSPCQTHPIRQLLTKLQPSGTYLTTKPHCHRW